MPDYPRAPSFDATLARMYKRKGVDTLPAHLEEAHGIAVSKVQKLDVGMVRVDRQKGTPVVVRLFSARREHAAVLGDLAVLEQLQAAEFPAEHPFGPEPLSVHEDQSALVTHFVRGHPKRPCQRVTRSWPWPRVADSDRDQLDVPGRALADADDSGGLPEAFIHPDPVPKNTVFTKDGPVLVDWAGAGRGPRLYSLALVLRSSWAGPSFMRGYAALAELDAEERRRAPDVLMTRALIDIAFRVCREPGRVRQQVKPLPAVRRQTAALAAACWLPPEQRPRSSSSAALVLSRARGRR